MWADPVWGPWYHQSTPVVGSHLFCFVKVAAETEGFSRTYTIIHSFCPCATSARISDVRMCTIVRMHKHACVKLVCRVINKGFKQAYFDILVRAMIPTFGVNSFTQQISQQTYQNGNFNFNIGRSEFSTLPADIHLIHSFKNEDTLRTTQRIA